MCEEESQIEEVSKSELLSKINDIIDRFNRDHGFEYGFELMNLMLYENRIEIEIGYTRKFFEISEYVASAVEQSDCNVENGECERLFEKLYNEQLSEINDEYAISIDGYLKFNDTEIKFHRLKCDGDYCDVGLEMDIVMPLYDVESILSVVQQALTIMWQIILLYDATLPSIF